MNPIFNIGDEVVVIAHTLELVSLPMTIKDHIFTENGYMYTLEEIDDSMFPEDLLRHYDDDCYDYWDYLLSDDDYIEEDEVDEEQYEIWFENAVGSVQKLHADAKALPKPATMDEMLDAYNLMKYLAELTLDEIYQNNADEIMNALKKGETVSLEKYIKLNDFEEDAE